MNYWKTKYLTERIGDSWYIFGEYSDGCVDLADPQGDLYEHIPRAFALELIALRDKFLADVVAINDRLNDLEPGPDKD